MHVLKKTALVAASLLALVVCMPPLATADEAAFGASSATWAEAYNAGDADRIVALYAKDAILMPPDAAAAAGPAAMRKFLTGDIATSKAAGLTLVLADDAAGISGELGWRSGTFKLKDTSDATVGKGKWLEVWRKADGKWLMIRDIWNNDAPAAAPQLPKGPQAPLPPPGLSVQ
jgi:ketosteroid isomerase-like protein